MRRSLMILGLICLFSSAALGETESSCADYANLPELDGALTALGDIDHLAAGDGHLALVQSDLDCISWCTNPATGSPQVLGTYTCPMQYCDDVAVVGDLVFVSLCESASPYDCVMAIIDFSTPATPTLRSSTSLPNPAGRIYDIAVAGDLAYLAGGSQGCRIYDITDPAAPVFVNDITDTESVNHVAIDGSTCWLTGDDLDPVYLETVVYLRAYDVTDPLSPTLLGETTEESNYWTTNVFYAPVFFAGRGYLIHGRSIYDEYAGQYSNTYKVLSFATDDVPDITLTSLTDTSSTPLMIALGDDVLFTCSDRTLQAYALNAGGDVATTHILSLPDNGQDVAASSNRIWCGTETGVYGFGGDWLTAAPLECATPVFSNFRDWLTIRNGMAFFVVGFDGDDSHPGGTPPTGYIAVYDLTDPCAPVLHSQPGAYLGWPQQLIVHGDYLYTRGSIIHWPSGTDHGASNLGGALACDVNANTAYTFGPGASGFSVVDLTDPLAPATISTLLPSRTVMSLVHDQGYLYVGVWENIANCSVVVYDTTDPLAPAYVNEVPFGFTCTQLDLGDGVLLVSGGDGLHLLDLTDPTTPAASGALPDFSCTGAAVSGNQAYVASDDLGYAVLDLSDPATPVMLGLGYPPGEISDLVLNDNRLICLDSHGLSTLLLDCSDPLASHVPPDEVLPDPLKAFALAKPYPNPFNPTVQIAFNLSRPGPAELAIFDVMGHRVRTLVDGSFGAGEHSATWNGRDDTGRRLASGVYFVRLSAQDLFETRKVVMTK